ncbi:MAG: hypothetical protein VX454_05845 [Pseudomonadota bacterium]|nr:hypothetical protein [Pseudomonadota bacterium]
MADPLKCGPLTGAVEGSDDRKSGILQSFAIKLLQTIATAVGLNANRAIDANAPGELP